MEFEALVNNALSKSQETTLAKTNYQWRFIKATYKANVYNSNPLTLIEEIICEILFNHGSKNFNEIASILGLSVENRLDDQIYKDEAEVQILINALKSLSEEHLMLKLDQSEYRLTAWGRDLASMGIKLFQSPKQNFDVYFDTLSTKHEFIHQHFKDKLKNYHSEESDWEFPSEDQLKKILEIQSPEIYNSELVKLAFYEDLRPLGYKECYVEVDVHALRIESGFELRVFWQDRYNDELSVLLNADEKTRKFIIKDLSFELASIGLIKPDPSMLDSFKNRWDWESLSRRSLDFTEDVLENYSAFWNWEQLSANVHIELTDELLAKFQDKWDWDNLCKNSSFGIDVMVVKKFAKFFNLNSAILRLDAESLISPMFQDILMNHGENLAPLTLENIPWSIPLIDLFDSIDKIKWQPRRWLSVETRTKFKAWEGSEDYELTVNHYEAGFIDNFHVTWNYDLLKRYWSRIEYEKLDLDSKKAFSDRISRDCQWNNLLEISEFNEIINWEGIVQNPTIDLNEEFLSRFKDHLDWPSISKMAFLTGNIDLVEIFRDKWDWSYISKDTNRRFDLNFLDKFADFLNWELLVENPLFALVHDIIHRYRGYLNWNLISASNRIIFTTSLLDEFRNDWNWDLLSSNKNVSFGNIKLTRFKKKWNWERLSENSDILLDSYNLQEFDDYWSWNLLAIPVRINKFLDKFDWQNLSPVDHRQLIIKFLSNFNEIWVWGILKLSPYIALDDDLLNAFKNRAVWDEIVMDERFRLSDKNLEQYAAYLSWDILSVNPRIVKGRNIERFKDNWNWTILSSNSNLVQDTSLLWNHRDRWNWEVVSKNYTNFTENVLLRLKDYWVVDLIDYNHISFNINIIHLFEDKWNWDTLSGGDFFKFDIELIRRFYLRWNWKILSSNEAVILDKELLLQFPDKWVLNTQRYHSILFDKDLLRAFQNQLDWNYLSRISNLEFDIQTIEEFTNQWDWELLSQNTTISLSSEMLIAFGDKWMFDEIDYKRISFDKIVLDHFVDRLDWHQLSLSSVDFNYDLLQTYRGRWDWQCLSQNYALLFTSQLLTQFRTEWSWLDLSLRKDWDFVDKNRETLEIFEEYWDWVSLLKQSKYRSAIKEQFPKIYVSKVTHFIDQLDLSLPILNLSEEHRPEKVYEPSPIIDQLFREKIINSIKALPRTEYYEIILGRTIKELRVAIGYGRADFDEPFREISAEQKVLIYCYLNMRKHFFTKYHVLDMLNKSEYGKFIQDNLYKITSNIIDVGCGPLTAGLAYGDYTRSYNQPKLTYHGVDISSSIMKKAKDFAESRVFNINSSFNFYNNWRDISSDFDKGQPILFIFSYLFANLNKVQTEDLAEFTQGIIEEYQSSNPIFLIFQNPSDDGRNVMFYRFLELVTVKVVGQGNDNVTYRNRIGTIYERDEQVKYVIMASPLTANNLILHNLLS